MLLQAERDKLIDEHLFGWDPTPGIVSVWADRLGSAWVWQRIAGQVRCTEEVFCPWLLATTLADLAQLGPSLQPENGQGELDAAVSYRELDGPHDGYRFLLLARPGFALERAIIAGASRRLGRSVQSIHDLDDTYYRVGPVEQYLMASGRVYFRGLVYADLHRLQFDLETTALDPEQGRIFMIAVRDSHGLALTLEAPTARDEARLIQDLCRVIRERNPDIIENHNLFGFDLPFLQRRAELLGVPLALRRAGPPGAQARPADVEHYGDPFRWHRSRRRSRMSIPGRELIDTLDAVRRYDFAARDLPRHRLKDVAKHFGVARPERVYLAGAEVFATYRTQPERVRQYALDDVAEVDSLSQRLLGAPFALAGMAPRRYERLASAGPAMGILEPLLVRAYVRAGAALPRQHAASSDEPDPHAGGALHLYATGIAEQVVKADVASLYPSIMRTYQIGPACDRLEVLLALVDRLTDLRLQHKAAAQAAQPGSLAAGVHTAYQAAMKILINSAYGYLGAGQMALFADRQAAGEVTRRGREVLDQVVAALQERGMALIEADTDGVYFAVPSSWDEARERALVAEIGQRLPVGIRLEFEGRYQAMFSHEVKNYALLTYAGELIVRGVALHSSRVEPFGERFLRQALRCTLRGDVAGVRAAFLATEAALLNQELTVADVASRVRLSKSAETYAETRATHREQHYEALLNAGRTTWSMGERIRVYRGQDGNAVWLPDEHDDHEIGGNWARRDTSNQSTKAELAEPPTAERRDYDVEHYLQVLVSSYASRLRKAFAPADFDQLFRLDLQLGLFDLPIEQIQPLWIRCDTPSDG
ncbi:MAG: DNA polymerase [Chloroflexi bacterium]|nr:MAG: DNA polymerase [Chloroflexota bacterium]